MRKIIKLDHTEVVFLPERVLYWPEKNLLALSDWHLGKATHFRKEGIALPQPNIDREFEILRSLISTLGIQRVVLLGDIFHSHLNSDWQLLTAFVQSVEKVEWMVTMGNHDIVGAAAFEAIGITPVKELVVDRIRFRHIAPSKIEITDWYIVGHLHPGCSLRMSLGRRLRVPCFMVEPNLITLPAFGELTGLSIQEPTSKKLLYPIVGEAVKWLKKA